MVRNNNDNNLGNVNFYVKPLVNVANLYKVFIFISPFSTKQVNLTLE